MFGLFALSGLLQFRAFANNLGIHCIGGQIDFSRPRYGATIDEDLLEELVIVNSLAELESAISERTAMMEYTYGESGPVKLQDAIAICKGQCAIHAGRRSDLSSL